MSLKQKQIMKKKLYTMLQEQSVLTYLRHKTPSLLLLLGLLISILPIEAYAWRQLDFFTPETENAVTDFEGLIAKGVALPAPAPKMSSSSKFKYKNFDKNTRGLVGFYKIEEPREKSFFGMRSLDNNVTQIENYLGKYFPGYEYVYHAKRKGKRKDKVKWIIVLDKEIGSNFYANNNPNTFPAMRLIQKLSTKYDAQKDKVYLDLFDSITKKRDKKNAIGFAPSGVTKFEAIVKYLRHAKNILQLQKMAETIPGVSEIPNNPVCVVALELLTENNLDSVINIIGCDPQIVMDPIINGLSCNQLVPFANRLMPQYQEMYLEKAEYRIATCIDCKEDYEYYVNYYKEDGKHMKTAFPNFVSAIAPDPELWDVIEQNQVLALRYKADINELLQNSIRKRKDVEIYNRVFKEAMYLEWGADWALDNLSIADFGYLIDNNVFVEIETYVKHRIYLRTTNNLKWGDFYLKKFRKINSERKEVYLNVFALEEDTLTRSGYILDYLVSYGIKGINEIQPYWDCDLKFFVAHAREDLAKELHQECIECTNNKEAFIKYANISTYAPHIDGFNKVYRMLKSEDLRDFFEDYPGIKKRIENVFVDKATTVGDIDWFLKEYSDSPNAKQASLKGIEKEATLHGIGSALTQRVATHLLRFGFDPEIVKQYISCDEMLNFLGLVKTAQADWQRDLFPVAAPCMTSENLDQYQPFFPEESEFQNKVVESIALEIQDMQMKEVSVSKLNWNAVQVDSIPLAGMKHPLLVLNTKNKEKGAKYILITPNGAEKEIFINNDNKVHFLPEKLNYCKLKSINEKKKGIFKKNPIVKSVSISVFELTPAVHIQFKNVLNSKMLRERYFKSCTRILDNKASWEDYELVLGSRLAKFAGNNQKVDQNLRRMALETSQLYFNIAEPYYPSKRYQRIMKKIGESIERGATAIFGD